MHEIPRVVLIPIRFFGLDLSVTNHVLLVWIAGLLTVAFAVLACRRRGPFARGLWQSLFEVLFDFVDRQIVRESIGRGAEAWTPFVLTLFLFILAANLLGLVPAPSFQAATANINVTAALAVLVFVTTQVIDLVRHGPGGYLRRITPPGVPWWVKPLLIPIELVARLARPISLAIRLFANMMAGHAVLLVFLGLLAGARFFVAPFPLLAAVAMECFELFVAFLQAFIFASLSALYLREALEVNP
ncbi:MAG: F0F1 ATP synthase subunit A [Kiritimatiellae bacterium]|nr:F0F1 ATP synthase subunit A [Kiritimatiellia bacterium]